MYQSWMENTYRRKIFQEHFQSMREPFALHNRKKMHQWFHFRVSWFLDHFFQKYSEMRWRIHSPHSSTTKNFGQRKSLLSLITLVWLRHFWYQDSVFLPKMMFVFHLKARNSPPFSFTQLLPLRWLLDFAASVTPRISLYMGRYTALQKSSGLTYLSYWNAWCSDISIQLSSKCVTAGSRLARKLVAVIRASSSRVQVTWMVCLYPRHLWGGYLQLHLHLHQTQHQFGGLNMLRLISKSYYGLYELLWGLLPSKFAGGVGAA